MALVVQNTFGRFHDMKHVRDCLRELKRGQLWRPKMKVVVQSTRKGHEELPMSFTHARGALLQGIALGAAVGLGAGIVISFVEAGTRGIQPVFIVAFCLFGLIMGGFAGALVGPMNPDPVIEKIEKAGDVMVAVESTEISDIDWASEILARYGAEPQHTASSPITQRREQHAEKLPHGA